MSWSTRGKLSCFIVENVTIWTTYIILSASFALSLLTFYYVFTSFSVYFIPAYLLFAARYAPGGVPPFGHLKPTTILMDEDLLQYDIVWGACGTAETVFPISPVELLRITAATVGDVKLSK